MKKTVKFIVMVLFCLSITLLSLSCDGNKIFDDNAYLADVPGKSEMSDFIKDTIPEQLIEIPTIPTAETTSAPDNNTNDYSQYLKKIWVVADWSGGAYTNSCSFIISKIENNKIEGSLCTGGVAYPDFFAYSFTPRWYSNNLTGTFVDGVGICTFNDGEGTAGIISFTFHENDIIEATYIYTNIPEYILELTDFSVTGTYLFRPYTINDVLPGINNNQLLYPVNLDSWGDVNVVTRYYEIPNHPYPMVYLADAQNNILYEFYNFPNGIAISDVLITDLNGDGLKDIKVILDIEPDYSISVTFYQMKNGLFYDSKLDSV
jgi:hypothetical protein